MAGSTLTFRTVSERWGAWQSPSLDFRRLSLMTRTPKTMTPFPPPELRTLSVDPMPRDTQNAITPWVERSLKLNHTVVHRGPATCDARAK